MEEYMKFDEPQEPAPKKKGSFAGGFFTGILVGILVICVSLVGIASAMGGELAVSKEGVRLLKENHILSRDAIRKIDELTRYIDLRYVEPANEEVAQDAMYHALVSSLEDKYSAYYNAKEYEELLIDVGGEYYGIGAMLSQNRDTMVVTISKVYAGTPAEEAGLRKDDIILYVEDIESTSMELSELVQNIRGEKGTTVHLTVLRDGKSLEFDVERRDITLPSVEGQMLSDQMGYIQVSEFQKNTAKQFAQIYEDLETQGMKSVIVDLRANPGGYLDVVVDMLDYLLPEGLLVYTEDKYGKTEEYKSRASCKDLPMVVLVDQNSASASEIFAGAMKDYEYATLVGTRTFGKGIVQSMYPLTDGDAIKITTAKYYTPKGNFIHGVGIEPDVVLDYEWLGPEDATEYDMQYDNQLQKAIEILTPYLAE